MSTYALQFTFSGTADIVMLLQLVESCPEYSQYVEITEEFPNAQISSVLNNIPHQPLHLLSGCCVLLHDTARKYLLCLLNSSVIPISSQGLGKPGVELSTA